MRKMQKQEKETLQKNLPAGQMCACACACVCVCACACVKFGTFPFPDVYCFISGAIEKIRGLRSEKKIKTVIWTVI